MLFSKNDNGFLLKKLKNNYKNYNEKIVKRKTCASDAR